MAVTAKVEKDLFNKDEAFLVAITFLITVSKLYRKNMVDSLATATANPDFRIDTTALSALYK